MMVMPAIDLKDGKCVQLVGGKPGTEKVEIEDVIGVAKRWQSEGAEMLHVIDLDSALGTGSNEHLVEKIAGASDVPVQVGGGVRTAEQVHRLFEIGCERVIVGTRAIQDRPFIESMSEQYEDAIVVAIDSAGSEVLIKGWQEGSGKDLLSVAKDLQSLGIFGFLYTNVEVEGRLQGIDPVPIQALMNEARKPVIVSGGITTLGDLDLLQRMGAHAAVVGMAIYTGSIDFKTAVRLFR
ncbi:MAG: 1-(5-phosphoribosyl)-5-[(5-phosphoribosylamino)methylideneamino]imidazole-4-carboxamide isomerase [Euryarchaeota archaeon RBG_16_62_10]|nr:MAG: 1-(5-phosphoribosyl)-5-[(5-phosphoribosylamino)methylideneamino]imidazole-4-carboxamide isomerase [Euryarchaeota archaeon RBG_16_62_10]